MSDVEKKQKHPKTEALQHSWEYGQPVQYTCYLP